MTELGFRFDILTGRFAEDMAAMEAPIAAAATGAMDTVLAIVKVDGRASIGRAGFSIRWQNALRLQRFPKKGDSMEPSVYVWHKIPYAGVFEDGATIRGKSGLLWIPLPTTPKRIGRERLTPEQYAKSVGDLVSFRSKSGKPLLGARVRSTNSRAGKKVSLSLLRRQHNPGGRGVLRTVPLFVGITESRIDKKFSIREICAAARNRIPSLYAANFGG